MKKIALLMLTACFVCIQGFSQESGTPDAVKAKFAHLYPKVEKVKWGKDKNNYEAHFDMNKTEMSATFDANGNLVETEKEIAVSALPMGAADYVAKHYGGQKIKEAAEITAANGIITYEAEIKDGDVIFDREGQMVKFNKNEKEESKGKDKEDKD